MHNTTHLSNKIQIGSLTCGTNAGIINRAPLIEVWREERREKEKRGIKGGASGGRRRGEKDHEYA